MTKKDKLPKIKEFTNDKEVIQYDNEVSNLIDMYNQKMDLARTNSNDSDIAFFDMGKKLIEIQKKIQSDYKEDSAKSKKIFSAFKLRTSNKINKHISNIDKVCKVANFCETETYKKYANRLPNSWGTLYLLLSLIDTSNSDTTKLDLLMSDTEIVKDITRSQLAEKISAIKNPDKVNKKRVTIAIEDGSEPTQKQLKDLQIYLSRKFQKNWNITRPELEKEEPVKKPKKKTN
jgi:hypothetical protein